MLPTFVIGLREGLEAALIVGIVAAFLRKQGRRELLRWVFVGVAIAVAICVAAGVALELLSRDLPQKQQEGLETVIGALAVCMVTYMVIWMRRHSRELKGQLEGLAADAMSGHSRAGRAMVLMAFLAVIREGLETVVFLIAAFNESGSGSAAGSGAVLGIALAVALGYGIYRGGVRINLSKFFRATGLVLVLVAAGLVVNALHTAHEAGWLNAGQGSTVDLSWLVEPGSVQASLLTGMLGIQTHPVVIEVVGWLCYLVPVGCYVAWPPGRPVPGRALARAGVGVAVLAGAAALALTLAAPAQPAQRPVTSGGGITAQVLTRNAASAVVRTAEQQPVGHSTGAVDDYRLRSLGPVRHTGVAAVEYRASVPGGSGATGRPTHLDAATVARLNGGRLPIGIAATTGEITATYHETRTLAVWLDSRTDHVLDLVWSERVTVVASSAGRSYPLTQPVATEQVPLPAATRAAAIDAAQADHAKLDRHDLFTTLGSWLVVLAGLALLAAAGFALSVRRRKPATSRAAPTPARTTVPG